MRRRLTANEYGIEHVLRKLHKLHQAARAVGALSIGVATGHHSAERLDAAGADVVLPDLSDTAALLDVLTAHVR